MDKYQKHNLKFGILIGFVFVFMQILDLPNLIFYLTGFTLAVIGTYSYSNIED